MNLETMRLLVAKGLSAADLLEVAETMAVRVDRTAAERQARHRAKVKAESEVVTVTRDVTRDTVTDPALSPSPNENNSNPHPHTHPDITPQARGDFPKPDWCEAQVWRDLKANRKAKRLPCTATAHAKLLRDLEKLSDDDWPPGRLLEAIVARGWAAAYDPRETSANDRQHSRVPKPTTRQIGERLAARLDERSNRPADSLPRLGAPGGYG